VDWAADAKGLFVSSNAHRTTVDTTVCGPAGPAKSLPPVWAIPSHDGKYVAMLHPDGSKQRLDAGELLIALGTGQKEARPLGQGPRLLRRHRPPTAAGGPQQFSAIGHRSGVRQLLLLCKSFRASGAYPLLWTTSLMAPEAWKRLDAWAGGHCDEAIPERAAAAYARYQKCSLAAARRLFATGW
jgi:hypothetical protein